MLNTNVKQIGDLYKRLYTSYGPQGWWPLLSVKGTNPTKTGSIQGYHPGDYSHPRNEEERFEICVGAILTQNTSWTNVEKALRNLKKGCGLTPKGMKKLSIPKLKELIKVAGYYNQKSKYLTGFVDFFEALHGDTPSRAELIEVKGIGPETADSMLLYAFKQKQFIVDTYTRRILSSEGIIDAKMPYYEIQELIKNSIEDDLIVYQEFHALLVEHAKRLKDNPSS